MRESKWFVFSWPVKVASLAVIALAFFAAAAQAEVVINETIPIRFDAFGCNGETVAVEGSIHLQFRITEDQAGGLHIASHTNINGSGTGLVTGTSYRFNEADNDELNVRALPVESTFTRHVNVIGAGQVPNFQIHLTQHITINANGELTADVINESTPCN
ncbi:MAG TPA: hypothetical protein VGK99_21770 [Acidobacteriota bacterium]